MELKPLFRWTIGPVSKNGFLILEESIRQIRRIYEDKFDLMICYNQINVDSLNYLRKYEVSFYDQTKYKKIPFKAKGEIWKIYPPRLRLKTHEIIADNDLILLDAIPEIDQFLKEDATLLLEAREGMKRYYGKFDKFVPKPYVINTGFYGMPPQFNLYKKIRHMCKEIKQKEWLQDRTKGLYDDQGIIAATLLSYKKFIIIKHPTILNYNLSLGKFNGDKNKIKGIHFVGANIKKHPAWMEYQRSQKKIHL